MADEKERSVKSLKAELADEHNWRVRLRDEVKQLTDINERLNKMRVGMYESLAIERNDLFNRIQRIDARIQLLGFNVPVFIGPDESK